jgi:hypothetical protein
MEIAEALRRRIVVIPVLAGQKGRMLVHNSFTLAAGG